jgi:hypothetical protein
MAGGSADDRSLSASRILRGRQPGQGGAGLVGDEVLSAGDRLAAGEQVDLPVKIALPR